MCANIKTPAAECSAAGVDFDGRFEYNIDTKEALPVERSAPQRNDYLKEVTALFGDGAVTSFLPEKGL